MAEVVAEDEARFPGRVRRWQFEDVEGLVGPGGRNPQFPPR